MLWVLLMVEYFSYHPLSAYDVFGSSKRRMELEEATGSYRDEVLREYGELRAEMLQKIDLHNKLLLFIYTSTAALLGVAASMNEAYVSLIPIPVVMLTSLRIAYYRDATAKLAAYQIVFIEPLLKGVKWERRNVAAQTPGSRRADLGVSWLVGKFRYWDFPFVCLICFLVYLAMGGWDLPNRLLVLHGVAAVIALEVFVSWSTHSLEPAKGRWVCHWTAVKQAECGGDGGDRWLPIDG